MKRRAFLQLGAGAGLGLALGFRRPHAANPAPRTPRRLLLVFAAGGWDTTYAIDPKDASRADLPAGAVRRFSGLDVFCDDSRPGVTQLFERHAPLISIVRGIATDGINHAECQRRIVTGTRENNRPDLGAMVAHGVGLALPVPYLILGDIAYAGPYAASSARVGATNQIVELLGGAGAGRPGAEVVEAVPDDVRVLTAEDAALRAYSEASLARARAERGATGYNRRRVEDFAESIARGDRLRALGNKFGHRGELLSLDAQVPLALDALEQGLSQTVMLSTRLPWDTHSDNHLQAGYHDVSFASVAHLVDELVRRPGLAAGTKMIDDTVVLFFSEMARGCRVGGEPGHEGKGHWQYTSAVVIGAGVRGGRTFGSTGPDMLGAKLDLHTGEPSAAGVQPFYANFIAGMLELCGIDPATQFPDHEAYDAFVA